jgi:hypothetical protein
MEPELIPDERTPVAEWTDDEWLAVMKEFPPNEDHRVVERWVAQQRKERQHGA